MVVSARLSHPLAWAICPWSMRQNAAQNADFAAAAVLAGVELVPVRPLPGSDSVVVTADQVRRDRQPLEIVRT